MKPEPPYKDSAARDDALKNMRAERRPDTSWGPSTFTTVATTISRFTRRRGQRLKFSESLGQWQPRGTRLAGCVKRQGILTQRSTHAGSRSRWRSRKAIDWEKQSRCINSDACTRLNTDWRTPHRSSAKLLTAFASLAVRISRADHETPSSSHSRLRLGRHDRPAVTTAIATMSSYGHASSPIHGQRSGRWSAPLAVLPPHRRLAGMPSPPIAPASAGGRLNPSRPANRRLRRRAPYPRARRRTRIPFGAPRLSDELTSVMPAITGGCGEGGRRRSRPYPTNAVELALLESLPTADRTRPSTRSARTASCRSGGAGSPSTRCACHGAPGRR